MQMSWLLRTDFWESNLPGGFTVGWLDAMRPVLKGHGLQISRRLGWGPCAREMHFGTSSKFSGPKLVWLLQTLERCEFDCWHGMSIGVHSAPNGVKAACHAAMPMLTGAAGLVAPHTPDEIIAHIARFVVWLIFQDCAVGPTGARAPMIGPNEGPNGGFSIGHIDLGVALSACSWCDKCMYYAVPLHR